MVLAVAAVVLGLRTLAEGAYNGYLSTALYTLIILAGLMFFYTLFAAPRDWLRGRRERRREPGGATLRVLRGDEDEIRPPESVEPESEKEEAVEQPPQKGPEEPQDDTDKDLRPEP